MPNSMQKNPQTRTVLSGANAEYIAHLYTEFLSNPASVDESWKSFLLT